jgi:hypothetical protein
MLTILSVIRRYARAERALCENAITEYAEGVTEDTPEFLHANRESHDAAAAVPWWLRPVTALIDWHIVTDLDYWHRTGQ